MSASAAVFVVAVAAIGTYVMRGGLIQVLAGRTLPAGVVRSLQYVAPAVLSSLTVSLAVGADGVGAVELAEVAAMAVAVAVAWWSRNLIWTFVGGMATLWVLAAVA